MPLSIHRLFFILAALVVKYEWCIQGLSKACLQVEGRLGAQKKKIIKPENHV